MDLERPRPVQASHIQIFQFTPDLLDDPGSNYLPLAEQTANLIVGPLSIYYLEKVKSFSDFSSCWGVQKYDFKAEYW